MIEVTARAKINLALHVTGRRADGYHLLDSLVAFADLGDRISVEPAGTLSLRMTGPFAADLSTTDNLCLHAARALNPAGGATITLEKNLPVASGIGGGSADAAATLTALAQLWGMPLPPTGAILALGADLPVCLAGQGARMRGIGEDITPLRLPDAWLVLVNPGTALATARVFHALQSRENAGLPTPPAFSDAAGLAAFLRNQRNDLEPAARTLDPAITTVIDALAAQPACLLARMSGSGATCFGLFPTESASADAARSLRDTRPGWWVKAARLST